jgi:membrane-bound lytic murein transglycosylase D
VAGKKINWTKGWIIFCFAALTGCASMNSTQTTATPSNIKVSTTAPASTTPQAAQTNTPPMIEPVQSAGTQTNGQYDSLWDVIRTGYTMNHYYTDPRVQMFITQYTHDPSFLENITAQSIPYMYTIVSMLQQRDMPTELALLPIVESSYQPNARSYCGALGIWQLMPAAAKRFNANENYWFNGRKSVSESTGAALDYLKYLYNYFNGDWYLALAAYNAGEGTVQKAQHYNADRNLPTDFWDLRLPQATENYVPQLLALAIIINDPGHYGITLPVIPNRALIVPAALPQQMSLSQAAKFANINESELKALNPGLIRSVTPPASKGSYDINLPVDKVATFEENCAANPSVTGLERYTQSPNYKATYGTYKVESGDTLYTASQFTGVSMTTLKHYNHLKSNVVRPGQVLRYPIDHTAAYTYLTYRVKRGDTLDSIARHYQVSIFDLMQWNHLNSQSKLHIGERLVIRQKIDN